jgi:hypothetical protein
MNESTAKSLSLPPSRRDRQENASYFHLIVENLGVLGDLAVFS